MDGPQGIVRVGWGSGGRIISVQFFSWLIFGKIFFFVFSHIFSLQPFGASAKYFCLPGSIVQIYFLQFLPLSPRDQMGSPLYCHIFPNVITWIAPYVVNISPHVVKWAALILSYI